jgi:hypothetical protein
MDEKAQVLLYRSVQIVFWAVHYGGFPLNETTAAITLQQWRHRALYTITRLNVAG